MQILLPYLNCLSKVNEDLSALFLSTVTDKLASCKRYYSIE